MLDPLAQSIQVDVHHLPRRNFHKLIERSQEDMRLRDNGTLVNQIKQAKDFITRSTQSRYSNSQEDISTS